MSPETSKLSPVPTTENVEWVYCVRKRCRICQKSFPESLWLYLSNRYTFFSLSPLQKDRTRIDFYQETSFPLVPKSFPGHPEKGVPTSTPMGSRSSTTVYQTGVDVKTLWRNLVNPHWFPLYTIYDAQVSNLFHEGVNQVYLYTQYVNLGENTVDKISFQFSYIYIGIKRWNSFCNFRFLLFLSMVNVRYLYDVWHGHEFYNQDWDWRWNFFFVVKDVKRFQLCNQVSLNWFWYVDSSLFQS